MQGIIILFCSWLIIKIIMLLPGLKEMGRPMQGNIRAYILFLLPFFATFLGSREAADLSGNLPGPLRIFRAIIYVIVFINAIFFLINRPRAFKYCGGGIQFMLLYGLFAIVSSLWSVGPFISLWKGFEVFSIVLSILGISYYLKSIKDVLGVIDLISYYILYIII